MSNDNHHRRKTKHPQSNAKRTAREVPSSEQDFNIRGVSGDGKSISGYFAGRRNERESQSLLRRIAYHFSVAIERSRDEIQMKAIVTWLKFLGIIKYFFGKVD